jgi:hypothetical protein
MRRKEAAKCARRNGKFDADTCRCSFDDVETTCVESSESQEVETTCVESSESVEETTKKPTCKCKCSDKCKKRKMIIDVLLKYFLSEYYDKECCKEECECPEGSTLECEDSSTESNHEILVRLFKNPDESEKEVVETTGPEISESEKEEVSEIVRKANDAIVDILKKYHH